MDFVPPIILPAKFFSPPTMEKGSIYEFKKWESRAGRDVVQIGLYRRICKAKTSTFERDHTHSCSLTLMGVETAGSPTRQNVRLGLRSLM
jgi:hypothetical protein